MTYQLLLLSLGGLARTPLAGQAGASVPLQPGLGVRTLPLPHHPLRRWLPVVLLLLRARASDADGTAAGTPAQPTAPAATAAAAPAALPAATTNATPKAGAADTTTRAAVGPTRAGTGGTTTSRAGGTGTGRTRAVTGTRTVPLQRPTTSPSVRADPPQCVHDFGLEVQFQLRNQCSSLRAARATELTRNGLCGWKSTNCGAALPAEAAASGRPRMPHCGAA